MSDLGAAFFTTQCKIPADQSSTIQGRWRYTPVPVAFKQILVSGEDQSGNFTSAEVNAITAAADTWNTFMGNSKGFAAISYSSGSALNAVTDVNDVNIADMATALQSCSYSIVGASGFNAPGGTGLSYVVISKDMTGGACGSATDVIACTKICTVDAVTGASNATGLNAEYKYAAISINYRNFFSSGMQVPDLQTVIVHEFGHLMGLDHSCDGNGRSGFPVCGTNQEYDQAVMYPSVDPNGAQNRLLQLNDQTRANCLYN